MDTQCDTLGRDCVGHPRDHVRQIEKWTGVAP